MLKLLSLCRVQSKPSSVFFLTFCVFLIENAIEPFVFFLIENRVSDQRKKLKPLSWQLPNVKNHKSQLIFAMFWFQKRFCAISTFQASLCIVHLQWLHLQSLFLV